VCVPRPATTTILSTYVCFQEKGIQLLSVGHNCARFPRRMHLMLHHSLPDAAQHSTAQHSTAQHSTAQHSTAQHSTAQLSTAQLIAQPKTESKTADDHL